MAISYSNNFRSIPLECPKENQALRQDKKDRQRKKAQREANSETPERTFDLFELRTELATVCMTNLTEREYEVVELCFLKGYKDKAAATELSLSVAQVQLLLLRATSKLRVGVLDSPVLRYWVVVR